MRDRVGHVGIGDIVRVRQWDDLVDSYGMSGETQPDGSILGYIDTPGVRFRPEMKCICGKVVEAEKDSDWYDHGWIGSVDGYALTKYMVEPLEREEFDTNLTDETSLLSFLDMYHTS